MGADRSSRDIVARLRRTMESTTDEVARNDLREIVRDIEAAPSSADTDGLRREKVRAHLVRMCLASGDGSYIHHNATEVIDAMLSVISGVAQAAGNRDEVARLREIIRSINDAATNPEKSELAALFEIRDLCEDGLAVSSHHQQGE